MSSSSLSYGYQILAWACACFSFASAGAAAVASSPQARAMQPNVAQSAAQALLPPRADLVVHLTLNAVGVVYPYQSFWVENVGTADAPATTVQALCTAYKGNVVFGPCSQAGKINIPALPAPKMPHDPAARFVPTTGWTPGGMPCDQWDAQKKAWAGVSHCVIVATVDPDHGVVDAHPSNNQVQVLIQAH